MLRRGEIWRDGKFVTGCQIRIDAEGARYVDATDKEVPIGDYDIKDGDGFYPVVFDGREWPPRNGGAGDSE